MPIIRRVFGPFGADEKQVHMNGHIVTQELRWYFNGIRGDKTMAHWVLTYDVKKREFIARNIPLAEAAGKTMRKVTASLPRNYFEEHAHPDAWLDDRPVKQGTVTAILKQHLPAAEIAKATALSITRK